MRRTDVVIIGAGLAGLSAARTLTRLGIDCEVLEASDGVGGRVRTDRVEGFLLDRGFQVLLTAYPECRRELDYASLDLRRFEPGARVRWRGGFRHLSDPWRRPARALETLLSGPGTLRDRWRILRLRRRARAGTLQELWERPEASTRRSLQELGFSAGMTEGFLRPFLAGIYLEGELRTSSRMLEFVLRMFACGDATLPAAGMGAIPAQLAAGLPEGCVQLGAPVAALEGTTVHTGGGAARRARAVLLATGATAAAGLLPQIEPPAWRSTASLQFRAPAPPLRGATLVLNGEGGGPLNHLCVVSEVAASYAPAGASLVSANTVGLPDRDGAGLEEAVRRQLRGWFGEAVDGWELLRTYRIREALPARRSLAPVSLPPRLGGGLYVCGDHRDSPSIQGAMASGRRAAEALAADLGLQARAPSPAA